MVFGAGSRDGFTVKSICGCRVVFGPVPVSEFGMLTHGFSKKALMATDIADRIGATFVIGEPGDLAELRKLELPVSEKRHADYQVAYALGLPKAAMWLRIGERGLSSNAMCKRIFGVPDDGGIEHPHDPDDLRRCLAFLEAADAHDKVALMQDVSPKWAALVGQWGELVEMFRKESAKGKSAPKTHELMKEVLE